MKQLMKRDSMLIAIICLLSNAAMAVDSNWGSAVMYVDDIKTVEMSSEFKAILAQSTVHVISSEWTSSDMNVGQIISSDLYTCTFKAVRRGGVRINCHLFYKVDGALADSYYTVDGFYQISIIEHDPSEWFNVPDSPTDNWQTNGNFDYSWYSKNKTEFTISSNMELAGMAFLVNNGYTEFEGKTIKLASDIDLSDKRWVSCKSFKGTFDGQGHSITGIYIGSDSEDQKDFGFWNTLNNATITDVTMVGVANYAHTKVSAINTAAGGVAGSIASSAITKCKVGIDVYFKRGACSAWSATSALEGSDIGGIVGTFVSGTCTISHCTFIGSIKCLLPESKGPQGVFIGGIIGSANYGSSIECCEVITSSIQMKDYGQSSMYRTICGIGYYANPKSCRSIIDKIFVQNYNNPSDNVNDVVYYVAGICRESRAINCYSVISEVELSSKQSKTSFYMSGINIARSSDEPVACFSNSDISINSNVKVLKSYGSGNGLHTCYDGNTSFTKEQMQTNDYLASLNIYSALEMDGPVWSIGSEGYPYLGDMYETGIGAIKAEYPSSKTIYDLQGRQLNNYRKGINIIGGRKVIVK